MADVPAARSTLRVLAYLAAQPGPSPAAAVAQHLGLPRSTVYHLLSVLVDEGFVTHLPEEHRYGLGTASLSLGSAYARQAPLARLARPVVARLVETTGESAHLAVLHGREVLYLVEQRAPHRLSLVTDVDVRLPSHLTASGRAVLARLPAAQVRALFPSAGALADRTGVGPRTLRELREVLRDTRRRGHATEDGEVTTGLASVAHAAVDHTGYPVAGVALTFWSDDVDDGRRDELAAAAGRAAVEISRRLGARG
ncbi:IclR family transcriptional regulator [Isoptericola cucumis]|uniref:IclR family transcriptional regulator n=1 Tax=Isoptericola cucumis TaxID=1776856 RepID=A0ABQ2BAV1_9MICO|nr:IclR family transcriptional regulator [Isoptericola cucumis]GGI09392.1 IclR family transcriptional regulator [Isoptericola cucumis]